MAVFSVNQNRQFYYAGAYVADVKSLAKKGDVTVSADKEGCLHINQLGYGGVEKSDIINPTKVSEIRLSGPKDTEHKLKAVSVTLSSEVNSGTPIAGEEYILRVNFRQLYCKGDEDIYQKYGVVAATKAMEATTDLFWLTLANSLVHNFKRTFQPLLDVVLVGESNTVITSIKCVGGKWYVNGTAVTPGTAYTGIQIVEKSLAANYKRGTYSLEHVQFEVIPTTVYDGTSEVVWGVTEESVAASTIGNGYDFADLEYFCMGERGDQYRYVGWPNVVDTQYFVDPEKTYYAMDITFHYDGDAEDVQKSPKAITLVSETKTTLDSIKAKFTAVSNVVTTANYK